VTAVLLLLLGLLDGAFSGFRAMAGRDGRTDKRAFARRALLHGMVAGFLTMSVVAAALLLALAGGTSYSALERGGRAMAVVFVPYALVVLLALLGWVTFRKLERQTLMSTLVLGPFTLVRPALVLMGTSRAWVVTDDRTVGLLALFAGALVLAVEPVLVRMPLPSVPPTPAPWAAQSLEDSIREPGSAAARLQQ
jgi:hypothetical protein